MKMLDTSPLVRHIQDWFDEEEPTAEIWVLGSLIRGKPATLPLEAPLSAARELFLEQRIAAIAVVDGNRLIGVVTRTDVLRDGAKPPETTRVADSMSGYVLAMPAEASIDAAAALMATEQVGQVVVTNTHGDLVGIVSALDIARHVARKAGYLAG